MRFNVAIRLMFYDWITTGDRQSKISTRWRSWIYARLSSGCTLFSSSVGFCETCIELHAAQRNLTAYAVDPSIEFVPVFLSSRSRSSDRAALRLIFVFFLYRPPLKLRSPVMRMGYACSWQCHASLQTVAVFKSLFMVRLIQGTRSESTSM